MKPFYIAAGILALILGIVGIVLPLLPTTPFLLLASACFVRGSDRLNRKLLDHPILGPYILSFRNGEGIPLRGKIFAILFLWASLAYSAWLLPNPWLRLVLLFPGIGVTTYLIRTKTRRPESAGSSAQIKRE